METRKWNTVKEVLVKGGGTMEVGSYFTEHKGNGITLTIEEPVGITKLTGVKRTVEYNGKTSSFFNEDALAIFMDMMHMKNKYVKCFDKFDVELKEGDIVDVQMDGEHEIYKKEDGQLYFKPYGKEDRVSAYFSNDMIKVER